MRNNFQKRIDGFGLDREDEPSKYSELRWGRYKDKQNIHFFHGTLPIFDRGINIIKEECGGEKLLLENIRERLARQEYPVFVATNNGEDKLNHIMHNKYLSFCYELLSKIEGSLIIYVFNFGDSDLHIIDAINIAAKQGAEVSNKLFSIYIGIYSEESQRYVESIKDSFKYKVNLFDAKTTRVWR
jgi:hypothetical protein